MGREAIDFDVRLMQQQGGVKSMEAQPVARWFGKGKYTWLGLYW